eukprot:COSAG02_NODE_2509_length_8631_cov_52.246484_6_plen_206_part_00
MSWGQGRGCCERRWATHELVPLVRDCAGRAAVPWKANHIPSAVIIVAERPARCARAVEVSLFGTEHLEVGIERVRRAAGLLGPPAAGHQFECAELGSLLFPRRDAARVALSVTSGLVEVAVRAVHATVDAVDLAADLVLDCRVVHVATRPGRLHGGFVHAFGLADRRGGALLVRQYPLEFLVCRSEAFRKQCVVRGRRCDGRCEQ